MKRYEISIEILNKDYVDSLIIALVRQGYEVYLSKENNAIYYSINEEDLQEIEEQ